MDANWGRDIGYWLLEEDISPKEGHLPITLKKNL
jgi:hypothetical protein